MSRDDMIRELDTAFGELQESIAGLTPEQMLRPWYDGWTVRDILGHIIGWHEAMEDVLRRLGRGEKPVPEGVDYNDSDAWNARFAELWKSRTPDAAIVELNNSKQRFVAAALTVPDDRFVEGRTAHRALIGNGAHHYQEHAPAIRAWRQQEGI